MQWWFLCYCMGTKPGQYRRGKRDFHPSISITFKKLKCAKTASLMSSRDSLVRHLATQRTLAEASAQRQGFKPFQQVVEVMQEKASLKTLAARAKGRVAEVDTSVLIEQCRALSVQGQTVRQFEDRATDLCSQAILTSPDHQTTCRLNMPISSRCCTTRHAYLTTNEVGSRGFINATSLDKLYAYAPILHAPIQLKAE